VFILLLAGPSLSTPKDESPGVPSSIMQRMVRCSRSSRTHVAPGHGEAMGARLKPFAASVIFSCR
jgi:hypothetical protein